MKGSSNMKFDNLLKTFVKHDLSTNSIPMLIGEPGIGKSSWVEDLAQELHTKAFTLACNQLADKSDLTGQRLVPTEYTDNNGKTHKTYVQVFYPHVVIQEAINYANNHPDQTPILFLDELNRTTPDVTSEALSIPTMRSIGNQHLPDNLRVITAGNDKGNVSSLDKASISRFVLYHVKPDTTTFLDLDQDLNPYIKTTLTKYPDDIFEFEQPKVAQGSDPDNDDDDDDENNIDPGELESMLGGDQDLRQITTPRTISSLSRWLNSFSDSDLLQLSQTPDPDSDQNLTVLYTGIIAHVGDTLFAGHLADTIDKSLAAASTIKSSQNNTLKKPKRFDDLLEANTKTITDIEQVIDQLTDKLKQDNLIYALYDSHLNTNIINELFSAIPQFDKAHIKKLAGLASTSSLNEDNTNVALNNVTPAAQQINQILQLA